MHRYLLWCVRVLALYVLDKGIGAAAQIDRVIKLDFSLLIYLFKKFRALTITISHKMGEHDPREA